jgi:hypothetical protein
LRIVDRQQKPSRQFSRRTERTFKAARTLLPEISSVNAKILCVFNLCGHNEKAPKALNMKARGKREAKRSASPLGRENNLVQR